jgi:tRNA nucleotidyltransferase (CCA-adding enzyme)
MFMFSPRWREILIGTLQGFGTPLEDALRRDITINALFYNVHTRSVEDLTNKVSFVLPEQLLPLRRYVPQGLNDLRNGTIRTPLPPRETFLDDPLRILRCIRFASKFGYNIDSTTQQTIVQADVQVRLWREKMFEESTDSDIS